MTFAHKNDFVCFSWILGHNYVQNCIGGQRYRVGILPHPGVEKINPPAKFLCTVTPPGNFFHCQMYSHFKWWNYHMLISRCCSGVNWSWLLSRVIQTQKLTLWHFLIISRWPNTQNKPQIRYKVNKNMLCKVYQAPNLCNQGKQTVEKSTFYVCIISYLVIMYCCIFKFTFLDKFS